MKERKIEFNRLHKYLSDVAPTIGKTTTCADLKGYLDNMRLASVENVNNLKNLVKEID
jgi:hypothetical protein